MMMHQLTQLHLSVLILHIFSMFPSRTVFLFALFLLLLWSHVLCDVPQDWLGAVNAGDLLYVDDDASVDPNLLPSIGNGYIAWVVNADTMYVAGLFNGKSTIDPSHRAKITSTMNIGVGITDGLVETSHCGLDLRHGMYIRRSIGKLLSQDATDATANGREDDAKIDIQQTWAAHRHMEHVLVHEIDIKNGLGEPIEVCFKDTNLFMTSAWEEDRGINTTDIHFDEVSVSVPAARGYLGRTLQEEVPGSGTASIGMVVSEIPECMSISSQDTKIITLFTVIYTSVDATSNDVDDQDNLIEKCSNDYLEMLSYPLEDMWKLHALEWSTLWQSGIQIDHLETARAINASLYFLLSSIREDHHFSVSPGGLATNGYNGHVFWDAETWMFPPLCALYPSLAENVIKYRFNRIAGAEAKAKSYKQGYQGTMWPWESAFSGQETCPVSAPTGQLEQHISADVMIAIQQMYLLHRDTSFLSTVGYPILEKTADFWVSRVKQSEQTGLYVINDVIPPDEYAVGVNNSAYTNAAVALALEFACEAARLLSKACPTSWQTVAANMTIPYDSTVDIHPEYDGYDIAKKQVIKQADVVLMGFPLEWPMPVHTRQSDLEYYDQVTDPNGPSMTFGMHAVGWLELNDTLRAEKAFSKSYLNSHAPFQVWTETPTGGATNFITGVGGFLQGVIFGYGGMRIHQDGVIFRPQLLPGTSMMRINGIHGFGCSWDIMLVDGAIEVMQIDGNDQLCVDVGGKHINLPMMEWILISGTEFVIAPC
eukprot:TRINITY_DN1736_c0_g1_i3.p1 TRINITY_DN1736_c0_g1~~TRINITY_DN1736_c0_g1_i3.p1  ORF type:complete len:765 (-),score=196.94 TRINITY_DN1736_c0_g1_i3:70-2364(-)